MSWLTKALGSVGGSVIADIANVADQFITTPDEKLKFQALVADKAQRRLSELEDTIKAELGAKERVLIAELSQSDAFTKRARPSVVYAGIVFILLNHVVAPYMRAFGIDLPETALPTEFWVAWGGLVGTWVIGRTAEKRGSASKVIGAITGRDLKASKLLD